MTLSIKQSANILHVYVTFQSKSNFQTNSCVLFFKTWWFCNDIRLWTSSGSHTEHKNTCVLFCLVSSQTTTSCFLTTIGGGSIDRSGQCCHLLAEDCFSLSVWTVAEKSQSEFFFVQTQKQTKVQFFMSLMQKLNFPTETNITAQQEACKQTNM